MTKPGNFAIQILKTLPLLATMATAVSAQNTPDLSGDWEIKSSVGGQTPITVNCTLIQNGNMLGGSCTPVMANPEPSELTGKLADGGASWGYGVVFNGNPGRVDFVADKVSASEISGTLSLSGTEAPFVALKQ